jgi:RHS repeat-associated protein
VTGWGPGLGVTAPRSAAPPGSDTAPRHRPSARTSTSVNGTADEYGTPRDTATIGQRRYGWIGTKQRAADTPGGLTLMGVRLYNPTTGRFLSVDPIAGGNANPYEYCSGDPVNCTDLDGRWSLRNSVNTWSGRLRRAGATARWLGKAAWRGTGWLARGATNSKWGKRVNKYCGFIPGVIGAGCGAVYTLAYARQGRWSSAAASAVGTVGGKYLGRAISAGFRKAHGASRFTRRHRLAYGTSAHLRSSAFGATSDRVGERYSRWWKRRKRR